MKCDSSYISCFKDGNVSASIVTQLPRSNSRHYRVTDNVSCLKLLTSVDTSATASLNKKGHSVMNIAKSTGVAESK